MKKITALFLSLLMLFSISSNAFALTDTKVFTDPVQNTYRGTSEASNLISNLNFSDIPAGYWARDAIVKAGAFNMVKGYENQFNPNGTVTNQEAVGFAIRIMGLEDEAQTEAINVQNSAPESNSVRPVWSIGYLSLALQNGLITQAQYNDAINPDQEQVDPDTGFRRNAPVTREQIATWIVQAINYLAPDTLTQTGTQQAMYTYSDWENVSVNHAQNMEICVANGIIKGTDGKLNPKGSLSRAEMAQILANLDTIYFNAAGIERKTGTVGGIRDNQLNETAQASMWRNIYIRNNQGLIDILQYSTEKSSSPQAGTYDAVTVKGNRVTGLGALSEGDEIEYYVRTADRTIMYAKVTSGVEVKDVTGVLQQVDYENGQIHITDNTSKRFIYSMVNGLYGNDGVDNFIITGTADTKKYLKKYNSEVPYGSMVKLTLANNVVNQIEYVGQPTVIDEIRGIVVENNTGLGYITIVDNNGNEVTKNYYETNLTVEKQQYYDASDEIGYYDQVFPNFKYDPRDTTIDQIEPGDIVFIRPSSTDPDTIESISASTNYIMKYGKVTQKTTNNGLSQMLITYEDKQTTWFDVADSIFVSKDGKPINFADIQNGDWVKVLVNQAIISPGYVIESIKEISVEGIGHDISTIVKGKLGAINPMQNQISIQDAYTLNESGWTNYQQIKQLSIANNDIDYYYEGKQISLDYAMQFLKRADGNVYVALENNYAGEKVAMVSFRNSRDDVLNSDTVVSSDGLGSFSTLSSNGSISTDAGTIVRRNGRLTTGNNIMIPDYATVVLNGNNKAAVVDIFDTPGYQGVMIARGRILSVDEGQSFKVKSMSQLSGYKWVYTPVEREFSIDHTTQFITADGPVSMDTFIDYTENSVTDQVYNIVTDGTKAIQIISAPYSKEAVRGTVYNVGEGTVGLKDATYYLSDNGSWKTASEKDNAINVTAGTNCIVVRNNQVSTINQLQPGDKVRVMVDTIPNPVSGSMTVNGYVILVES